MRAVAVLLVIAYHVGLPVPGGYVGVDVFFVVSGFLITGLLTDELTATGTIRYGEFLSRRVRRLLPALAVMTTVTMAASHYLVPLGALLRAAAETGAAASLFVANLHLYGAAGYFAPTAERNPLLHTWSLSVEEQFYFLLPLVLLLVGRRRRDTFRTVDALLIAVTALIAASLAAALVMADVGWAPLPIDSPERFAFYAPMTRAWEFLVGSALALGLRRGRSSTGDGPLGGPAARIVGASGLAAILSSAVVLTGDSAIPGVAIMPAVLGTAALIWSGRIHDADPVTRLLSSRPLVWIGDRSYGWYLWHWPLIVLARFVWPGNPMAGAVAVAVALGLAEASFRFVEGPLRDPKIVVGGRNVALITLAAVLIPAGLSSAVSRAADVPGEGVQGLGYPEPCGTADPIIEWSTACVIDAGDADGPMLLLVGDSHCRSSLPGVRAAASAEGFGVAVWCLAGTPLVAAPVGTRTGDSQVEVRRAIEALDPSIVIVSNRSRRNVEPDVWSRWSTVEFANRDEALGAWGAAVAGAAEEFFRTADAVILISQVPEFTDAAPLGPSRIRPARPTRIDRAELDRQRGDVVAAENAALAGMRGVVTVDPAVAFCGEACVNGDHRTVYYYDDHHLAAAGSRMLTPALRAAITEALSAAGADRASTGAVSGATG